MQLYNYYLRRSANVVSVVIIRKSFPNQVFIKSNSSCKFKIFEAFNVFL